MPRLQIGHLTGWESIVLEAKSAPPPPLPPPLATAIALLLSSHRACRYHSLLARSRRDALASLSPAQQLQVTARAAAARCRVMPHLTLYLQNRSADAVFKSVLKRDVHAPAGAAALIPANTSLLAAAATSPPDCVGCSSYMLPVLLRTSMSEKISATLQAQQLPRLGAYNRAVACVARLSSRHEIM
jgi:hypothetical protein